MWILSPSIDLLFFVATPLLIVPVLILAQSRFSLAQIAMYVASFGALGHHLPGMLRAYGDRALFSRFRWRFLLAPVFIGTTCVLFAVREINGIVLVAYLWGVWHALMQTYGFLRIYDAKAGVDTAVGASLDRAMCTAWFGIGVLHSPARMFRVFSDYYAAGGPPVPGLAVSWLVSLWTLGTAVVTLAWGGYLLHRWLRKQGINYVKLLVMSSSFSFWWYTNAIVPNMLLGVALFEVFHDVQYLAIVWAFNVNRVERNAQVGRFTTFLFRRSWALIGVYVGLVLGYGWLNFVPPSVSSETLSRALRGLIVGSALLHFYYDSFIWKVREPETRDSLGLTARTGGGILESTRPVWAYGLRWAPLVVVAVALVLISDRAGHSELERSMLIAGAAPASDEAQNRLGVSLLVNGDVEDGLAHLKRALQLNPRNADAHSNLGLALAHRGDVEHAHAEYLEALRLDPRQTQAYSNLGNLLVQQGKLQEAIESYQKALRIDPEDPQSLTNLAGVLLREGRVDEAIATLQRVLRARPSFKPALENLRIALSLRSEGLKASGS